MKCCNQFQYAQSIYRLPLMLLAVLSLASCITPKLRNWPDSIPAQQVFIQVYAEDDENQKRQSKTEYLQWTLSFYQGNMAYQSGWQDIEDYVIDAPTENHRAELLSQLRDLGMVIGSEWARHNDIRRIDTRMLSLWGSTIQLAPDYATQQQSIKIIASDVRQLVSGALLKEDIFETRYDKLLGLEPFGGF
jgi:hypothetical protein